MSRSRRDLVVQAALNPIELLETRRLLSRPSKTPVIIDYTDPSKSHVVELAPETIDPRTGISPPNRVADPADIVWVNRATSDGFDTVFGTFAATARGVVDAVITRYEQMIGSFDYPSAGQHYSLSLSMNASGGFGASASLSSSLGGKPFAGSISMLRGNNAGSTNTDHGWFLDPTPNDVSEFTGNITNGFMPTANSGAAFNKGDFYGVVASEMTHCMGLFGNALAGWSSHSTNTGVHDSATGVGNLWVFQGPSIKHLGTSDNAGAQDFGSLIHSAESGSTVNFGGSFYRGAEDQGNAFFAFNERSMINNTFALMFKDAYGYLTVNPDKFGTAYSIYNETADTLTIRGGDFAPGHSNSNDVISVTRSGNIVTVSVNAGSDVGGTGATPGDEDLPAFVSQYDLTTQPITSITIDAGAGNDQITVGADIGATISVQGGTGTNSLTVVGGAAADTITVNTTSVVSAVETINVAGGIQSLTVDGSGGTDIINDQNNLNGTSFTTVINSAGADTVNVNTDASGSATALFNTSMQLGALNVGAGGLANMAANGNNLLSSLVLSITGTGTLDLFDNDMLVTPGNLGAIQALINSARSGGTWLGSGITSTTARNNAAHNTTLGAMTGSDFIGVNGAVFDGQAVVAGAAVVKYTYYGDTDFNGLVNFDDYVRTDNGFNNHRTGWTNGDFNGDGTVNFDDYVLIDLAFNTQTAVL